MDVLPGRHRPTIDAADGHTFRIEDGKPVLAIVAGPQAFVPPAWYSMQAEHGRVKADIADAMDQLQKS